MIAEWVEWFQVFTGLKLPHMSWLAAATTVVITGVIGVLMKLYGVYQWNKGRREGHREARDFREKIDRGQHAVIERLHFIPQEDGTILFDRDAKAGIHPLIEVLRSERLCELVAEHIRHRRPDGVIFPPGELHGLMMGRVDLYIGGDEEAASMSTMFERKEEYNEDEPFFTVRNIVGDDGFEMIHILIVNPRYLVQTQSLKFKLKLKPRRQRYMKRYFHLFPMLASSCAESVKLFEEAERTGGDEDKAGESALFWKTMIRTQKAGVSREVVESVVAETVKKVLSKG